MTITVNRNNNWWGSILLAVVVISLPTVTIAAPRDTVSGHALPLQGETRPASFLPEAFLNGIGVEDLPVDVIALGQLQRRIAERQNPEIYGRGWPGGVVPECHPPGHGYVRKASEVSSKSKPLVSDFLQEVSWSEVVFAGRVTEIVSGWDSARHRVSEVVAIDPEEILRAESDMPLKVDGKLLITLQGGRLRIGDVTLCDERPPGVYSPQVGERLLIAGVSCGEEGCFIVRRIAHLDGGEVQPFSGEHAKSFVSTLSEVRSVLEGRQP